MFRTVTATRLCGCGRVQACLWASAAAVGARTRVRLRVTEATVAGGGAWRGRASARTGVLSWSGDIVERGEKQAAYAGKNEERRKSGQRRMVASTRVRWWREQEEHANDAVRRDTGTSIVCMRFSPPLLPYACIPPPLLAFPSLLCSAIGTDALVNRAAAMFRRAGRHPRLPSRCVPTHNVAQQLYVMLSSLATELGTRAKVVR